MKKRLLCILLIAALLVTVIATSATAAESASANEQEIFSYLTGTMGLNSAAASGILANIYYETGFIADISVGTYYGLFMYYAPLASELKSWCSANGFDYTTVNGQMNFFRYKMEGTYQNLLSSLRSISNTGDGAYSAADLFCRQFEKPANTSYEASKRGSLAQNTMFPKYYSASSSGSAETAVSYTAYVTASILNVRSAAGIGNSVIGSLSRGTGVSVTAETMDGTGAAWCKLSSGGYISKAYLSTTAPSTGGTTYTVTASALNIRSGAGMDNSVIGSLWNGASVSVVSETQDGEGVTWCQLSSGGWVSKDYLNGGSSGSNSSDGYTVTASALNIRSGAGMDHEVIGCLYKGSAVSIVDTALDGSGTKWCQLPSGGYISMDYVA